MPMHRVLDCSTLLVTNVFFGEHDVVHEALINTVSCRLLIPFWKIRHVIIQDI